MVVRLLAVVTTVVVAVTAVVTGRVSHEAVLKWLITLLVPLEVSDHLLLLDEHSGVAVQAMEVLPDTQLNVNQSG